MTRREFLCNTFVLAAGICLIPSLNVRASAYGVQVKETNLSFRSLENRLATDAIVIHHIGNTDRDVSAAEVHEWHLANGWSGIGYHYLIRKDGTIERGRPRDTVGAHCFGHNSNTIGINIVGNFEFARPNEAQLDSAARLTAALCQLYRIRPSESTIVGHRDFNNTACPGENMYEMIPSLRRNTAYILERGL